MTLAERRTMLIEQWERTRIALEHIAGALTLIDQLIAEEGTNHASREQSPTTLHGNEIRGGKEGRGDGHGHEHETAS